MTTNLFICNRFRDWRKLAVRALAGMLVLLGTLSAQAQTQNLPGARLFSIFPAGGKQGATYDVTIAGADLDDVRQLNFSDPGITGTPKMGEPGLGQTGPQPLAGQFTVVIKPEVPAGIYEARAIGKYGISNPRAFVVGSQNELTETEPNNTLQQAGEVPLNSIVNGRSDSATDLDYFKFAAKAGERVLIDCWAFRIDSRMDATLVLYNSAGDELARNRDTNRRDALIDFTVLKDGEYVVAVHDFLYAGSNEYFYRLSIGTAPYLDFVFPPAGLPGSQGPYTVYGRNLPGGQPAKDMLVDGKPLEMISANITLPVDKQAQNLAGGATVEPAESGLDAVEYRLNSPQGLSNPLLVGMAGAPIVVEREPNDDPAKAQLLTIPCEYVGQFYPRNDQDWVAFEAKKGDTYWIEVFSQRLGLPTDPFLLVQQVKKDDQGVEQVTDLQASDDAAGNIGGAQYDTTTDDPVYSFVAPADGTYRVLVRDLYSSSRADPRYVYRLSIRPPQPDFRLVATPQIPPNNADPNQMQPTVWSPLLRKGGAELVDVYVFRREGFAGEIQVIAENLPAGVNAAPITIGPGQNVGPLVLTAAEDAPEGIGLVSITGKARIGEAEVVRSARTASMIWGGQQNVSTARSRVTRNLAVAVIGAEPAPFALSAGPNLVLEMSRMGTVTFPVNIVRRGEFKGNVSMSALGLPQNVQPKQNTNVEAAKPASDFEIKLPNNAPLGTYSFFVLGISDVPYARNPEALQAALARKAAVEKISADEASAAKSAAEAKMAAEKKLADATAAMQKAAEAAKAAEKAAADAQAAATTTTAKVAEAQAALEKDSANAALAAAKQAADKEAQDAAVKLTAAAEAKAAGDKAAAEAGEQHKVATEAKAAADKSAADADAKAKQVAAFLQTFNQQVGDLQNKSKPNNVKIGVPSTSITLKITAAPVTLEVVAPPAPLKQGAKLEVPVKIARLYNFADPVLLKLVLPAGVGGISAAAATIAQGQTDAPLIIEAGKDATPGVHKVTVQAIPKFGGTGLPVGQEIVLTIEKVEPAK
jgi:hypothetical protein